MSIQPNRLFSNVAHAKHQTLPKSQKSGVRTHYALIGKVLSIFSNKVVKSELSGKDPIYVNVNSFRDFLKRHIGSDSHEKINSLTHEQITNIVNNLRNQGEEQQVTEDMIQNSFSEVIKEKIAGEGKDKQQVTEAMIKEQFSNLSYEQKRERVSKQKKNLNNLFSTGFCRSYQKGTLHNNLNSIISYAVLAPMAAIFEKMSHLRNEIEWLSVAPLANRAKILQKKQELKPLEAEMKTIENRFLWMEETLKLLEKATTHDDITAIDQRFVDLKKRDPKVAAIFAQSLQNIRQT